MKKITKALLGNLIIGCLIFSAILFIPRRYDVAKFERRAKTQYWELETGSRIGYTKIAAKGSASNSPIIYLHGGPGGKISDQIIEALSPLAQQGHDLYFYDQIGSGHSERLRDISEYSVKRHQQDLLQITSKINAEKVILIGQSWGACLAINFLQDYQEKVAKIILTGPGPILPINSSTINQSPPDSLSITAPEFSNQQGNKKANNIRTRLIRMWAYIFQSKLASDQEADNFFTHLNQELSKSTNCTLAEHQAIQGGGGYYSHIMTSKQLNNVKDKRKQLQQMKIPILILRGQCDNQKWGFTNEYLQLFERAELKVIEGAGHNIINSRKAVYQELIHQFLEKE